MLSEDCVGMLHEWRFTSAAACLNAEASARELDLIGVLHRLFGDVGWFTADMGLLVALVVDTLVLQEDEEECESHVSDKRDTSEALAKIIEKDRQREKPKSQPKHPDKGSEKGKSD